MIVPRFVPAVRSRNALALDARAARPRARTFADARRTEIQYARELRRLARAIGHLVDGFPPGDPEALPELDRLLRTYAVTIQPWARNVARRMLGDVDKRNERMWREHSRTMSQALREELQQAPTGRLLAERLEEQVTLITSLPIDAAERVHKLTTEGLIDSTRSKQIAEEILQTGHVTVSRANLIARTEVARTASGLTQARAVYVGSEGYIWRTARDKDVRRAHKLMEGKFVRWSHPPTLVDGTTTHAGEIYNCRCYPEPVLPERFEE